MSLSVCIFCGANSGSSAIIVEQAKELCSLLIEQECNLVYGGGKSGLMGIIADEFLKGGREVYGVRPEKLIKEEYAHKGITELIVVKDMHQRKSKMVEMSDFFIALPGGVGTLDEIIETYTLYKIGFITKKSGILNTENYYKGLKILLDDMEGKGFLKSEAKAGLVFGLNPKELLSNLRVF